VLRKSIARTVAGTTLRAWKRAAQLDMNAELTSLGLVSSEELAKDTAEEPACRKYFMHGLGHSLGLGVHDLAPMSGPFAPGWVMTVEPAIYLPEEGFAVRLENDVLITETGVVDLMAHIPIEADDIEALMAGKKGRK
jgi:Xaa-Pro aminopeptidase